MAVIPFSPRVDLKERGLMISLYGEPKSGRTHLAYTFPEPIRSICFDGRWHEARDAFPDRDIEVAEILLPDLGYESWKQHLADFDETYLACLEACAAGGTVVIDNASDLWTLVYEVERETIRRQRWRTAQKKNPQALLEDQVLQQFDWDTSNAHMGAIVRMGKLYPRTNVVLIHKTKEKYVGNQGTGINVIACHSGTLSMVHGNFLLEIPRRTEGDVEARTLPQMRVDHCGRDVGLTGVVFPDPSYELIKTLLGR
jgi:AAA domain